MRARYIEAIRKLKKDGVKLKRTVHVVFGPGNSLFVSPSPVLPSHRYTHAHALTHTNNYSICKAQNLVHTEWVSVGEEREGHSMLRGLRQKRRGNQPTNQYTHTHTHTNTHTQTHTHTHTHSPIVFIKRVACLIRRP